jgi:hypothetical protein
MDEGISLEETNKIRISLGLKPLTDDSTPADDKDKQAETNYAKQREAETKQRELKYVRMPSQAEFGLTVVLFAPLGKYRIALLSECYITLIIQLLFLLSLGFQGACYLMMGLLMR